LLLVVAVVVFSQLQLMVTMVVAEVALVVSEQPRVYLSLLVQHTRLL
jgi:hypothetical protein